jgi:hypothetical protein
MGKLSTVVVCVCFVSVAGLAQSSADRVVAGEAEAVARPILGPVVAAPKHYGGIHWKSFVREWSLFVTIEQTERIVRESKTRNQLGGPFFRDWFDTVSGYRFDNWNDGGKVFTSYLAHPAQGATLEAIFWQNNDRVRFSEQDFHSPVYRKALLQSFAFATVDAVLWKLGPLSESSIGNVGRPVLWWDRNCRALHIPCVARTGVSDMVMNEVGGTAMTIGFQWLDKHLQKRIESKVHSRVLINTTRMLTYPPQSLANIVRFKAPWYRDNRR